MAILTLLTDFGTRDYYVAAVKGVILAGAPTTTIVDISHEVSSGDVAEASFLLAAAAQTFPAGTLHLAIVDPGVGSARRLLLVEAANSLFMAPDNGLLTAFLDAGTARKIERPDLYRDAPGATFQGRDRLAPVAVALLNGAPPSSLGNTIADPLRLSLTPPRRDNSKIAGCVVHIDRFGNLVTDIPSDWLAVSHGTRLQLEFPDQSVELRWVTHYADLADNEPGLLAGSLGTVELSLRGQSLADHWGIRTGLPLLIRPVPSKPAP